MNAINLLEKFFVKIFLTLNYNVEKFFYININKRKIYNDFFCALMLVVTAVFIYQLNIHTTIIVDDYSYSFIYGENNRVTSIYDIFVSQYRHYFSWGGRSIAHFFAQLFLMLNKEVFNVLNTLLFVLLLVIINFHSLGKFILSAKTILLTLWLILICTPAFGQVFLWVTGSCNYLWCPLISLTFLLFYRIQDGKEHSIIKNKFIYFCIFLLGIMAGWTNENNSIATVVMTIIFIYKYWDDFHRVNSWSVFGVVGIILGCLFLIMAPGNFERLHVIENISGDNHINILKNFFKITVMFFRADFLLYPLAIILLLRLFLKTNKIMWIYIVGMLVSMYSMIFSPFFPDRAKTGPLFFIIISVAIFYNHLQINNLKIFKLILLINFVLILTIGNILSYAKKDIVAYERRECEKINIVLMEKERGNLDVVVPENYARTKYCAAWGLSDLSNDPNYWVNIWFARYFNINSVKNRDKLLFGVE